MSNPCIRCGQERINGKSRQIKIGVSVMTYTQTICPDRKCQKVVDQAIADKRAKNTSLLKAKEAAKLARVKSVAL